MATTCRCFYGRCLHRGALLADGHVDGDNLICGLHDWDYRLDSGVSEYNNEEVLPKFAAWIDGGKVVVDADEIAAWEKDHPQPYRRDAYLGLYAEVHADAVEPHVQQIQHYAQHGLSKTGHHGAVAAMGVPRQELPSWDDIQIVTAQLATAPRLDDAPVGTEVVIGPNAQRPLTLEIPLMVSDMSFGALSEPAKVALARGAELAGTGICSGEGGMLDEEQAENGRYFYELRVRPLRLRLGEGDPGAGVPLQGRAGGQDRHRRPPAGAQERRQDRADARPAGWHRRDLAGALPGLDASLGQCAPSPTRCAAAPAASRSATSSPPSTSRRTSTPRSRSASTTSSSTAAAARPARRR